MGLEDLKWTEYLVEISRRSDAITVKDHAMGAAIGKMGAERILCQNLLFGSAILVGLDIHQGACHFGSLSLELMMVAFLVILVIQRNVAFLLRQRQLYALLFGPEHRAPPNRPAVR
jgi:hypothetical protein